MTDRLEDFRRVYAGTICAAAGVTDPRIVAAFAAVPRENFLGPGPWKLMTGSEDYVETPSADPAGLYQNFLFAIDPERGLNNGEPSFLASMIGALAPRPGDHVVHVGTGTGYYTAILCELVGPGGKVSGFELDPALASRSADNLASYPQVEVMAGSGVDLRLDGLDGLYVNAGATHPLGNWLDALAPGGRLVLPLTPDKGWGLVVKITRGGEGYAARYLSPTVIFPCQGARESRAAAALARALKRDNHREIRSLRRDRHRREASCWLHGRGWCLSTEPN